MSDSEGPLRIDLIDQILAAIGISVMAGLLEWGAVQGFGFHFHQMEANRALVAIVSAYSLFGLVIGAIAALFSSMRGSSVPAVALVLAVLFGLAVLRTAGTLLVSPVLFAAGLALGWASYRGLKLIVAKHPGLCRPAPWWVALGFLLVAVLALTARNALDFTGKTLALGAAGIGLLLLVWALRVRRSWQREIDLWRPIVTGALVVVASSVLAVRIPTIEPDVAPGATQASVLLITIDTLRADHVGAYGYPRARTPNLDALAEEGTLFRETVAPSELTGPSHTSILTGLLPENHGVFLNHVRVPRSVNTLADELKASGYVTGAFVSGYTTLNSASGLPSRFHYYDDELNTFRLVVPRTFLKLLVLQPLMKILQSFGIDFYPVDRSGGDTTDLALNWIQRNGRYPIFLWVHLFDPHLDYRPPDEFLTDADREYNGKVSGQWYGLDASERSKIISSSDDLNHMIALYDAEIAYADYQVGRLVDAVRNVSAGERLLIVATSDHGEPMGEHDLYWRRDLYDPTLLVPLIIVMPDSTSKQSREVKEQVRLIDVAPTIVEALGLDGPDSVDGRSLVGLITGGTDKISPGPAYSVNNVRSEDFKRGSASVRTKGWKLIRRASGWHGADWMAEKKELYNLREDPDEKHDVFVSTPEILDELEHELAAHWNSKNAHKLDLTKEELERLRSLGYFR